jgi:hypothetical protein
MGLAVRDDIGSASFPDPVEQGVELHESLTQQPFVLDQKVAARLGVRTAAPGDVQAGQGLFHALSGGQLQWPGR